MIFDDEMRSSLEVVCKGDSLQTAISVSKDPSSSATSCTESWLGHSFGCRQSACAVQRLTRFAPATEQYWRRSRKIQCSISCHSGRHRAIGVLKPGTCSGRLQY